MPPAYRTGPVALDEMADCGFTCPAGLVWSTASDQARLMGFLIYGDPAVLDDSLRAALTTAQAPMYPATDAADYGYGDDLTRTTVTALEAFADDLPTGGTAATLLEPPDGPAVLAGDWVDPHHLGALTIGWDGKTLSVSAPELEAAGVDVGPTLTAYAWDIYVITLGGQAYDLSYYADADGAYLVNRVFSFRRDAVRSARGAR